LSGGILRHSVSLIVPSTIDTNSEISKMRGQLDYSDFFATCDWHPLKRRHNKELGGRSPGRIWGGDR